MGVCPCHLLTKSVYYVWLHVTSLLQTFKHKLAFSANAVQKKLKLTSFQNLPSTFAILLPMFRWAIWQSPGQTAFY